MADAVTRRLLKELRDFQKEPNPDLVELTPTQDDDILSWRAVLRGENDTPYEGKNFLFYSIITYPIHPPKIKFITRICHPNISFKTGEICLDILKTAWSPAWTLQSACMAIRLLLSTPEPNSPLNCDAEFQMRMANHYHEKNKLEEWDSYYHVDSGVGVAPSY
ncbi:6623_t:CDS:2 [Ambispora gerdemannii]|uniref:6623_t:CDS:1 n=1 Tax=Ambispora gerdemannii TaxID=144530 RepID=A0A9N9AZ65_9GLOM|nr:6623_t:CDS:2 [Ambispora gerdemannii]